jgi:hypothetical protein
MKKGCFLAVAAALMFAGTADPAPAPTFAAAARDAEAALTGVFATGDGRWRYCLIAGCPVGNQDWGADSLTYTVALRYEATRSPKLLALLRALASSAPTYPAPCTGPSGCPSWSDVPAWDAIALAREYLTTGMPEALTKAQTAFAFVEQSGAFALGACPRIRYQQPGGGGNNLKTLETDANAIKAALLLHRATKQPAYLDSARVHYDAVRAYFLDPAVPLYTVYVFDDGRACTQAPHRFFASVNGDMIWSGLELYRATGKHRYLSEATATARAVDRRLSDGRGVFANLQAENDIAEPLVEAMLALAQDRRVAFARSWIIRNAAAALSARADDGSFGRFFDGPPPRTTVTAWQTNGGLALAIAAARLQPRGATRTTGAWAGARLVRREVGVGDTIVFRGSGIALLGTLGETCCEPGHARVLLDGRETFNRTGIWQNKSSSGKTIDDTVLFAWRWRTAGRHTIAFAPGVANAKEGGSFLHVRAYLVLG